MTVLLAASALGRRPPPVFGEALFTWREKGVKFSNTEQYPLTCAFKRDKIIKIYETHEKNSVDSSQFGVKMRRA